jgi:hypothetical protein
VEDSSVGDTVPEKSLVGYPTVPMKFLKGGRTQVPLALRVSRTVSKTIETLPFEVVPAEIQATTKKHEHSKVFHRGKTSPPQSGGADELREYVAQQPTHIRRLLRDCDLSRLQRRASFVDMFPGPLQRRYRRGVY